MTAATLRTWTLKSTGRRPTTMNEHRTMHFHARAADDKDWRATFAWLAKAEHVPALRRIEVTVLPLHRDARSPQDVAACAPAAKAAIDGLVDAGVVPDDGPRFLLAVTFLPPLVDGDDGLLLMVKEAM